MVHEETLRAYELAGYPYMRTPHDIAELAFENWIRQSGRMPIIVVNRITRIQTTPDKNGNTEFITWSEKRVGHDHVGNERTFTEDRMGQYDLPVFKNEWDPSNNTIQAVQVEGNNTIHHVPYSPEKIDELFELADKTKIQYYVQIGTKRYGIYSFDDFRNGKFEQLVQLGKSEKFYLNELEKHDNVSPTNISPNIPSTGRRKNETSSTDA